VILPFKTEIPFKAGDKYLVLENVRVRLAKWPLTKKDYYLFAIGFLSSKPFQQRVGSVTLGYDVAYIWVGTSATLEIVPKSQVLTLSLNASELRTGLGQRGVYDARHKAVAICVLIPFTKGPLDIAKVIEYIDLSKAIFTYKKRAELPVKSLKLLVFITEGCPSCYILKRHLKKWYESHAIEVRLVNEKTKSVLIEVVKLVFNETEVKLPLTIIFRDNEVKGIIQGPHSDYLWLKIGTMLPREGIITINMKRDIRVLAEKSLIKRIVNIVSSLKS